MHIMKKHTYTEILQVAHNSGNCLASSQMLGLMEKKNEDNEMNLSQF